jgi:hypothetical protein
MYRNLVIVCAVASGIGLLKLPYGYFVLLRLLFFVVLLVLGYAVYKKEQTLTLPLVVIGGLAILYNPLILLHLGSKVVWIVVNLGSLVFMFWVVESRINRSG